MKVLMIFLAMAGTAEALALLPKEFSAKFESVYTGQISGKEKRSLGELIYQYPSHMRFEMTAPDPLLFVANGSKSWYYRPPFMEGEAGELRLGDAKKLGVLKVFDTLTSEPKSNDSFQVKIQEDGQELEFLKKKKDHDIRKARLFYSAKPWSFESMVKIELSFDDGKVSNIEFKEKKLLSGTGKDQFIFTPPANTNIIKQ